MTTLRMISAASGVVEAPDLWSTRLAARFADQCPRMIESEDGVRWTAASKIAAAPGYGNVLDDAHGRRKPLTLESAAWLASPDGRRWVQDEDLVASEMLYSTGPVWDLIHGSDDRDFILACTRAYNDWLAEFCASDGERFVGAAKVPTTGAEDATAELRRAADLGLKGVVLDAWPGGADCPPAMEECEGFWETAAGLGMPISIYRPLDGTHEPDAMITAGIPPTFYNDLVSIIYANIPDRNPDIRFVSVAPNAGWAPAAYEQLSDTYMRTSALRKISLGDPDLSPSDYLRRFVWYVTQDDRTAVMNRGYFGEAHLMWGSFAFMNGHSAWPNTRQLFERVTSGISGGFSDWLAQDNVSRLYRLGNARPYSKDEVNAYENYALL